MTQLLALTGHLLHGLVVVGGLAGMAALLAPGVAHRAGLLREPDAPIDRRLADLRSRAAAGTLAGGERAATSGPGTEHPRGRAAFAQARGSTGRPATGDPLLAAAVVGSAAAGGVHAAVGPMHLSEFPLLAMGFLAAALLQAAWPLAVLSPGRRHGGPEPADATAHRAWRLAAGGAVLQGGCLAAWAASRTVGLPFGLHGEGALAVGPWDLAAVAWQLVALAWCLAHLLGRRALGPDDPALRPGWGTRGSYAFLGVSALVLVLLTLSGASA